MYVYVDNNNKITFYLADVKVGSFYISLMYYQVILLENF